MSYCFFKLNKDLINVIIIIIISVQAFLYDCKVYAFLLFCNFLAKSLIFELCCKSDSLHSITLLFKEKYQFRFSR
jgi:hypothetical protein